jgi:8-oxo-dGTP diphosphatase
VSGWHNLTVNDDHIIVRATCGVVVRDESGRVLLMCRSDEGTWGLPGGGVEPGETWERAALRECREETGWDISIHGLLGVYSDPTTQVHRYPGGRTVHCVGVVFLGSPLQRAGEPDGETSRLGWFMLDELPEPLFAPDVPVLQHAMESSGRPFIH